MVDQVQICFHSGDTITFAPFCLVIVTANIGDFIVALFDVDASWFVDFFIVIGMFLFSWFCLFCHGTGGTISALGTQWVNALHRIVPKFYANFTMTMCRKTGKVEKPRYCQYSSHCAEQLWYLVFSISSKKLIKICLFTCINFLYRNAIL